MTTAETQQAMVPLRPGIFEMPESLEGQPGLYGQRCENCNEIFAAADREYCANCGERALERIVLGSSGTVHTFTIVHQQLPGSLMTPPYVIARVLLPEGVAVQTVLCDAEPGEVAIGMPVEICLKALERDEEGRVVVNFFFRPRGAS